MDKKITLAEFKDLPRHERLRLIAEHSLAQAAQTGSQDSQAPEESEVYASSSETR